VIAIILILVSGVGLSALAIGGAALLGLYPFLPRDLGGAPDLDRKAKRVRIPLPDGEGVDGWWVEGTRDAIVVVFHGYGRNHTRAWRYGAFLNAAGYHLLAIDFRSGRYLDRKPTTLGHFELVDAQAALDWVRSQPRLAGFRMGLLGESLGGSVALMLAALNSDVAAVVVDCAFAHGGLALEDSCERWARVPRWPTAEILRSMLRTMTGVDPATIDPRAAAASLTNRPVFFIHGMDDNRFSSEHARQLWRAAGSKDPLWLMPGVGHNQGWIRHREPYEARVTAFFAHALLAEGEGVPAGEL